MLQNSANSQRHWQTRRKLSAAIWLFVPATTLFAFRTTALDPYFCTQPYNPSYDAMFVAATAGLGLTSIWALRTSPQSLGQSWRNALDLFEICLAASLTCTAFLAGVRATAAIYSMASLALISSTVNLARSQRGSQPTTITGKTALSRIASASLLLFAILFVLGPVIHPIWSGPQEPFVRWHPFSPSGELIWRGIFLSFAIGMAVAASDPLRRHRLFLVALAVSGFLHATEMAADNLLSAHREACNGNPQHLFGDVLGWYVVALCATLALFISRQPVLSRQPAKPCTG